MLRIPLQIIIYLIDSLILCIFSIAFSRNINKIKTILTVRFDILGDFVLWSEYEKKLHTHYRDSGYKVRTVVSAGCYTIAKEILTETECISIDSKKFLIDLPYRYRTLYRIYRSGYDIAIQPTLWRKLPMGDAIVRFAKSSERIGFTTDIASKDRSLNKLLGDSAFTKLISISQNGVHELQRNALLLSSITHTEQRLLPPQLSHFNERQLPVPLDLKYYVIVLGASWEGKFWEVEKFAVIAQYIKEKYAIYPVLIGAGTVEEQLANAFLRMYNFECINLVGKTSLLDMITVVKGATMVVCNDTGIAHVAVAVNTEVICVCGGAQYNRFFPYPVEYLEKSKVPIVISYPMDCFGCQWDCIFERERNTPVACIKNVSENMVIDAVDTVMTRSKYDNT